MKVLSSHLIKGRGVVTSIDVLPPSLLSGQYVTDSARRRWQVAGIETHAMGREHTHGKPAGLLLRGEDPLPEVDTELHLEPTT